MEDEKWELILNSDEPRLLVWSGDQVTVTQPFRFECRRCGAVLSPPEPIPPDFCPECGKRGTFEPRFPKALQLLWDDGWRVPWLLPEYRAEEKIDLRELYQELKNCIKKHVVYPEEEYYDVLTCWVLASWKVDEIPSAPYLLFLGEHDSGKTRSLDVLRRLSYRAIPTTGITPAVLFRQIEALKTTCLIDQAENQLKREYEDGAEKYAIICSGYKRGMYVARSDKNDPNKIRYYDIFGFKALSSQTNFDVTIQSRCITIHMEESIPEILDFDEEWFKNLRSKLLNWRLDREKKYFTVDTVLSGRMREIFLPLLWIAELVGEKDRIENFAKQYDQKRRGDLAGEFRAIVIGTIMELQEEAEKRIDEEKIPEDEALKIYLTDIKQALQGKGYEATTHGIGRVLGDLGITRKEARRKGRYIDLRDFDTMRKIAYYKVKYNLINLKE